jgi:hypothetical protein
MADKTAATIEDKAKLGTVVAPISEEVPTV